MALTPFICASTAAGDRGVIRCPPARPRWPGGVLGDRLDACSTAVVADLGDGLLGFGGTRGDLGIGLGHRLVEVGLISAVLLR